MRRLSYLLVAVVMLSAAACGTEPTPQPTLTPQQAFAGELARAGFGVSANNVFGDASQAPPTNESGATVSPGPTATEPLNVNVRIFGFSCGVHITQTASGWQVDRVVDLPDGSTRRINPPLVNVSAMVVADYLKDNFTCASKVRPSPTI